MGDLAAEKKRSSDRASSRSGFAVTSAVMMLSNKKRLNDI